VAYIRPRRGAWRPDAVGERLGESIDVGERKLILGVLKKKKNPLLDREAKNKRSSRKEKLELAKKEELKKKRRGTVLTTSWQGKMEVPSRSREMAGKVRNKRGRLSGQRWEAEKKILSGGGDLAEDGI